MVEEFSSWVLENGGDDLFLRILRNSGFNSKLSLGNFDFEAEDSQAVMEQLNCGQKCLLRGLVKAVSSTKGEADNVYKTAAKASEVVSKSKNLRSTLGKLFNHKVADKDGLDDSEPGPSSQHDDFQPRLEDRKRSRKGKYPLKGPIKRKVKEYRLKVVGMKRLPSQAPVGAERESKMKTLWIREGASANELANKIRELFGWSKSWSLQFMYSCGRHLRVATLKDVENAGSWDLETVRALMGNGSLYVSRFAAVESMDESGNDSVAMPRTVSSGDGDFSHSSGDGDLAHSSNENKELSDNIDKLSDMFPTLSQEEVRKALSSFGMDEAVERLLQESTVEPPSSFLDISSPIVIEDEDFSLRSLLTCHARKIMDLTSEYSISVNRSTPDSLWQAVMSFYKGSKTKSYKLKKELVIEFCGTGEVGADSGALRREFFEDAISQANLRLLEGDDTRRVLKKDWGMDLEYESFGTMVAHSLLLEGPGIPYLAPSMFQFLSGLDVYPVKEDIPLNAATHQLISFIDDVNDASTEDEIDVLLDVPAHSYILNNCGWKITEPITPVNKLHFLQHLIYNEIITQREANLKSFYSGLNSLGVGDIVKAYSSLTKSIFVTESACPITVREFVSLISSKRPTIPLHMKVYDYFIQFLTYLDGIDSSRLGSLLRFVTGLSTVPPLGLRHNICIIFQPDASTNIFPKSQACFSKLILPVVHKSSEEFFSAFIKALDFGSGYGNV